MVIYRLFGWWYRWQACKCAAMAMASMRDDDSPAERVWSYTVFFEQYMLKGSEGTLADFGPKDPVQLKAVE
jgi:hypothetical protein